MKNRFVLLTVLCVVALYVVPVAAVDFPARQKANYKDLQWIEIGDLHQDYINNRVNIVDVRSKLEFETIHTKNAVHLPVAKRSFESDLRKLVKKNPDKKTAFY